MSKLTPIDPNEAEGILGKSKVTETIERRENTSAIKAKVDEIATDECPDGFEYMGSVVMPVYFRNQINGSFDLQLNCSHSLQTKSAWIVNKILRHMCISVARDYGWEFTKKMKTEIREQ